MNTLIITGSEDLQSLLLDMEQCSRINFRRDGLALLLERYLNREFSFDELVKLANVLEMNDRLDVDGPADKLINNYIFVLANPEINGVPSDAEVMSMISALRE